VSTIRAQATWYRSALLLGLVDGADATSWADELISRYSSPDNALTDLSLTDVDDLSALRIALQPLSDEQISTEVAAALCDAAAWALAHNERSAADTFALLRQARQMLTLPEKMADEIRDITTEHYLAINTPGGEPGVAVKLNEWFIQFAGAYDRLHAPRRYHLVVHKRVSEAAAFVAALSRWINSPNSGIRPDDEIEVWTALSGTNCIIYLDDAALVTASAKFAPVPVSGTGAPPDDAMELIIGKCDAMGVEEVKLMIEGAVF